MESCTEEPPSSDSTWKRTQERTELKGTLDSWKPSPFWFPWILKLGSELLLLGVAKFCSSFFILGSSGHLINWVGSFLILGMDKLRFFIWCWAPSIDRLAVLRTFSTCASMLLFLRSVRCRVLCQRSFLEELLLWCPQWSSFLPSWSLTVCKPSSSVTIRKVDFRRAYASRRTAGCVSWSFSTKVSSPFENVDDLKY